MTSAATEALAFVDWQGPSTYLTKRGKEKPIVTGKPSAMFWRRWKQVGKEIRAGFISLRKLGKGQWEVIAWVNRETLPQLIAAGIVVVDPAGPSEAIPAGESPF